MADLGFRSGKRMLCVLPVFLFLFLCFVSLGKNKPGIWHDKATEFWKTQKWQELMALAENLDATGRTDPECLYLAALASVESENPQKAQFFSQRLAAQKLINWKVEQTLPDLYRPDSPVKKIVLYRTRALLVTSSLLAVFTAFSLRKPKPLLPWIAALSVAGCLLLIL